MEFQQLASINARSCHPLLEFEPGDVRVCWKRLAQLRGFAGTLAARRSKDGSDAQGRNPLDDRGLAVTVRQSTSTRCVPTRSAAAYSRTLPYMVAA